MDAEPPSSQGGDPTAARQAFTLIEFRFVARHDGRGNIVFADGHAESFRGQDVVETSPGPFRGKAILPQSTIVWTANPEDNPN